MKRQNRQWINPTHMCCLYSKPDISYSLVPKSSFDVKNYCETHYNSLIPSLSWIFTLWLFFFFFFFALSSFKELLFQCCMSISASSLRSLLITSSSKLFAGCTAKTWNVSNYDCVRLTTAIWKWSSHVSLKLKDSFIWLTQCRPVHFLYFSLTFI